MCPTTVTLFESYGKRHHRRAIQLRGSSSSVRRFAPASAKTNRMVANLSKYICHTNREPFLWDFSFASVADKRDSFYATRWLSTFALALAGVMVKSYWPIIA
jgi:hypothetical protein